jgi:hypothetical protein
LLRDLTWKYLSMFRTVGWLSRRETGMSFENDRDERARLGAAPAGPWGAKPPEPPGQPPLPRRAAGNRWTQPFSILFFVLMVLLVGARAYKDLSRPEAWAYWKDLYFSPSMTSSQIANVDSDGSGHPRPALLVKGTIGAAAAIWFKDRLDEAHLVKGDVVVLSSPGGDLNQAIIIGEIIRSRGLATAVGDIDASGRIQPSYCASACVLAYAGGSRRIGVEGSMLGVHRFVTSSPGGTTSPGPDAVAETQRIAGLVLNYLTRMGVSSAVAEAMSATDKVRWLDAKEAAATSLVTAPVRRL